MNSIAKKMLLVVFVLLPSACAHYPQHYAYYPGNSGYTIMHRNYYGERPDYYSHGYNGYFPHHHHDQYRGQSHWGNGYPRRHHNRDHD